MAGLPPPVAAIACLAYVICALSYLHLVGGHPQWGRENGTSAICRLLVHPFGYACEDHQVVTDDGYVLGLQRIQKRQQGGRTPALGSGTAARPIAFLQHGLLVGAECFLLSAQGQSLALVLADAGYDVWLGNTRASRWSHGHIKLRPSQKAFWKWSWDDLAERDLPAMLASVRRAAGGVPPLLYVGHSQGTALALAALQARPDVAAAVTAAVLLCPVAYMGHMRSQFLRTFAQMRVDQMFKDTGIAEFNLNNQLGELLVGTVCSRPGVDCAHTLAAVTGPNCCLDMARVREYLRWLPSSTSVQNMAHYAQMVRTGLWQKYDYTWRNMLYYHSLFPPQYDASRIPADLPVAFFYGGMDALTTPADVEYLATRMRRRPTMYYLPHYAHGDYVLSGSAKADVYDDVMDFFDAVTNATQAMKA